jgi:hypothetical protein
MRKFLLRGTMILFVSAMGFFGNGGQVGLSNFSLSLEPESASARMKADPMKGCEYGDRITPCELLDSRP